MRGQRAFTLIELLITVAVAAIVLTVGVPTFRDMILNNRIVTQTNELIGTLNLARSEAIKRGVRVTLCKSMDVKSCASSGGYEQGWIVFVDPNNNTGVDAGEDINRVFEAISYRCWHNPAHPACPLPNSLESSYPK